MLNEDAVGRGTDRARRQRSALPTEKFYTFWGVGPNFDLIRKLARYDFLFTSGLSPMVRGWPASK